MKGLPFTIDRSQWGSLIEQMTDGLRRAIRTGYYRPGDRLPSVRELVAHFGVSNRVPVAAIKKLREEGLVEAAPRNGCVVRHSRMPHWKGHVMCIVASGDFSFGTAMKVERIREAVFRANYLFTQVTVPRRKTGRLDMGVLDYHLSQPVDMAVLFGAETCIRARLEKANVPFVHVEGTEGGLCISAFKYDYDEAFREFVSSCRDCGVNRIVRVVKFAGQFNRLVDVLSDAGIANEEWNLAPTLRRGGREKGVLRFCGTRLSAPFRRACPKAGSGCLMRSCLRTTILPPAQSQRCLTPESVSRTTFGSQRWPTAETCRSSQVRSAVSSMTHSWSETRWRRMSSRG